MEPIQQAPWEKAPWGRRRNYDYTCDCGKFNLCFGKPSGCWYCGAVPPWGPTR